MPEVGRNDPCPCGSGAKYKRCCAAKDEAAARTLREARAVRGTGIERLRDFTMERFGPRVDVEAWRAYSRGAPHPSGDDPEIEQLFLPWVAFHWQAADDRPPARVWLDEGGAAAVDARVARWVEACLGAPFTLLETRSVDPGRSLAVRDLLCGRDLVVNDTAASRVTRPGELAVGKPVVFDRNTFLEALGPIAFDPASRADVVSRVLEGLPARAAGTWTEADLLPFHGALIAAYRELSAT